MKLSKYTHIIRKGTCSIIYNCHTEAVSAVENKLADFLNDGNIESIASIHPEFYDFLRESEFIVPTDEIEYEKVIERWKKEEESPTYSVFVNPTLDCNLNCWYCYEEHRKGSIMDQKTIDSVIAHVNNIVEVRKIKELSLSFFGGEPLIMLHKVILPLIKEVQQICIKNNVQLHVGFVTNGTLLTPGNIELLLNLNLSTGCSFQITFDGNKVYHDRTKKFANGNGSYDLILCNLRNALSAQFNVVIRLNMTADNIDSYYDLLSDLKKIPIESKKCAQIDFQHIWQDGGRIRPEELLKRQTELRDAFIAAGFDVKELKNIDPYRCYADRCNHVTVNYNGDLYKCTARDFKKEEREGILNEDGTLSWNEKRELREKLKFGNNACLKCRIYPLCHGGCSQYKIDMKESDVCIRQRSEEDIDAVIEQRVDYLLESLINIKKNGKTK